MFSSIEDMKAACNNCFDCQLATTRTNVVFGEGSEKTELMIVGEGPGEDEDLSGRPFVGRAGQLLDKILTAAGIKRSEIYIANMVKCRPPGNRNPQNDEIIACEHWLIDQIRLIKPKIIITLGNVPTQYFLKTKLGITKTRGIWGEFKVYGQEIKIMPMFHPAYLLRNPVKTPGGPKSLTWEDIKRVKAELGLVSEEPKEILPEQESLF